MFTPQQWQLDRRVPAVGGRLWRSRGSGDGRRSGSLCPEERWAQAEIPRRVYFSNKDSSTTGRSPGDGQGLSASRAL
jgi:hypothetical protein